MSKIKIYLSVLMGRKKVNFQNVSDATGLSRTTISNMYHEKIKSVNFETLEKLCDYFKCNLSDLIEYIPEEDSE